MLENTSEEASIVYYNSAEDLSNVHSMQISASNTTDTHHNTMHRDVGVIGYIGIFSNFSNNSNTIHNYSVKGMRVARKKYTPLIVAK